MIYVVIYLYIFFFSYIKIRNIAACIAIDSKLIAGDPILIIPIILGFFQNRKT